MRARGPLVLSALALALGGCGEERYPGGLVRTAPIPVGGQAEAVDTAVATVDVSLADFRLDPANPRVARAGVIAFVATNDGEAPHALAVDGPQGEVSTVRLRPGERRTIAVRLPPGTYKWLCPLADHEQRGMVGRIRIE